MKLISFVIPCYNSQDYMKKAIDSILTAKDDVEIIIVNDGSKDGTINIARDYEEKYKNIIKVIDKENGGHGSGVNAGLKSAKGKYFKVVDSDDWVDEKALKDIIKTLKKIDVDMFIANYVYEKENDIKEMNYLGILPENKIFGWKDINKFPVSKYLLMHSVIYKTKLLQDIKLELPEHTFYVDNIFVYYPLPYVKTMYYLNVPFYRYFIGREDQSVNEKVMIKRIDQQLKVNKLMIDFFNPLEIEEENLKRYLMHYLDIMMTVSTILLKIENTKEAKNKIKDLWDYLKVNNPKIVKKLKLANITLGPRFIVVPIYKIARKIYKFN